MAIMLKTVTTKPSDTNFFGDTNPADLDEFRLWQVAHEHVLGKHRNQVDANTWEHTYIFENQELLDKYLADRSAHPVHQKLTEYQTANNQTIIETVTVI
jgi:hypothetical protein